MYTCTCLKETHRHQVHRLDDVVEKIDSTDLKTTKSAPPPHRLDESGKWGKPELDEIIEKLHDGGVPEWPNVPVLKPLGSGATQLPEKTRNTAWIQVKSRPERLPAFTR